MKKQPIENKIYKAIIGYCEGDLEGRERIGNGHHVAQKITALVSEALLTDNEQKIMAEVPVSPSTITTREIADKLSMSSKSVSAQLIQIEKKTLLLYHNRKGKIKHWHR